MKNFIIKSAVVCVAVLLTTSGCKKFLDQEVPGKFPEQDFYKTDADAVQATTAIYSFMIAHYNNNWASIYLLKALPADESNAAGSGFGDQPGYQELDDYKYDATNDKIRDVWKMCYYTIFRCNKVINKVVPETELRKRLIAEAKTIRAYNYFELVSLWGDVPLILDDVPTASYLTTPRAAKADVYAQIEKDCGEAIPVLPLRNGYSGGERFHVTKGTAQSVLGKALLYQEKWPESAAAFNDVIVSAQYGLEPTIGKVFSQAGEFGIESVFEVNYTNVRSYDWGNFPWGGMPLSNIHVQLMGPRSDYYTKAPADSLGGGWGFISPKTKLWNAFIAAGDVNRRRNTIMSQAELITAGGNWTNPTAWDYEGYFQRKYGSFTSQTGSPVGELNYGTNWRLIRYSDVLLMAAEAYYRAGNEPRSRTELNKVRTRAGLADVSASGTALFDAIVAERNLELAFEGFRFTDLVRWGKAPAELGSLGFVTGKHELMPVPDNEVKTGALQQNPNY